VAGLAGVGAEPNLDLGRHAFHPARRVCVAIVDVVSRKWIDTLVSVQETATQVQVIFERSLQIEGLLDLLTDERLDLDPDDPRRPILLAVSDNGPPMTAEATRAFMALMAIAQHHGRPHTPTDQAWIESFFGHIKSEWPHLETITDPATLDVELERVRMEYNTVRLHEAIGYVTPDGHRPRRGHPPSPPRRAGPRSPAPLGLPSPHQHQPHRGDTMSWVIAHAISAVKSETPDTPTAWPAPLA
jgi:putative transposase